jgi:hypothetical protein
MKALTEEDTMLDAKDFTKVASVGFGDPHNSYAWSMEWFQGRLYVGTGRDILWLFARMGNHAYLDPYPVPLLPRAKMDLRGQIWRYTPEAASWEQVYTSPLMTPSPLRVMATIPWRRLLRARRMLSRQARQRSTRAVMGGLLRGWREWVGAGFKIEVARDMGYRNMAVYTDRHGTEALYVVTIGAEGHILRSTDGTTFEVITRPGLNRHMPFGFRPLVSLKGRLYTSPVGSPMVPNISAYPTVFETDDPARGALNPAVWRPVSAPGFGDPHNLSIFEMAVFKDHLYAGAGNLNGFQIWKTDATGSPPYRWTPVVTNGGYQGPSGLPAVISMCPFGEWLYVGSGRAVAEQETLEPAPGELIRIAPDDSWEVVAGAPRDTSQGFKAPISGMAAGFGNPFALYVWWMEEHHGWLYAGINDATTFLCYTPRSRLGPSAVRWVDQHGGVEPTVEAEGGFDLWRTQDGVHWTCITRTGFGNPCNNGVRTLKSTPVGLFVGTMNFFTEAKDPVTGEPRGGVEVWLGSP